MHSLQQLQQHTCERLFQTKEWHGSGICGITVKVAVLTHGDELHCITVIVGFAGLHRLKWSSGNTVLPVVREVPGSNRAGHGLHTYCSARLTWPSALRGTVNAHQSYGWVLIQVAMGESSVYSCLQADSKVKCAAWPTRWRPPGAGRLSCGWPKVNSRIWIAPYRQHYKYRPGY